MCLGLLRRKELVWRDEEDGMGWDDSKKNFFMEMHLFFMNCA